MRHFLKKIKPALIFLIGAFLAVVFEHTIFGLIAFKGQPPSLVLPFLCLSLFFTAGSFWFWCFRIFIAGFLIEMTSNTVPGLKLVLILFCGMLAQYLLTLINRKSSFLFVCFFSIFFLIVEATPLIIRFILERAAFFPFYTFGARFIFSILLAAFSSFIYARFFRD